MEASDCVTKPSKVMLAQGVMTHEIEDYIEQLVADGWHLIGPVQVTHVPSERQKLYTATLVK